MEPEVTVDLRRPQGRDGRGTKVTALRGHVDKCPTPQFKPSSGNCGNTHPASLPPARRHVPPSSSAELRGRLPSRGRSHGHTHLCVTTRGTCTYTNYSGLLFFCINLEYKIRRISRKGDYKKQKDQDKQSQQLNPREEK